MYLTLVWQLVVGLAVSKCLIVCSTVSLSLVVSSTFPCVLSTVASLVVGSTIQQCLIVVFDRYCWFSSSISFSCYLSSSCHAAHKASTQSRQPALSATAICTLLQFFHPAISLSLAAVLLHVVLGLPLFRQPSGAQVNAVLQLFCSSFLMMWLMNFHLLLRTSLLWFSISAIFRTSLFVILSCQRILNIRLRHLLWKILFSSHLFIFHVSQPYIKTGFTSALYSLTLVRRLMLWLLQIFFNLKNTPLALTTLFWVSSVLPPSLETVAPSTQIYQHPLFLAHLPPPNHCSVSLLGAVYICLH